MRRWFGLFLALGWPLIIAGTAVGVDVGGAGTTAVDLTGTLHVLHADDFANGTGRDEFLLDTTTGERLSLTISGPAPEDLGGATVRVRGTQLGKQVRVALDRSPSSLVELSAGPVAPVLSGLPGLPVTAGSSGGSAAGYPVTVEAASAAQPSAKKVAVLLINFKDDTRQPYTAASAASTLVTSAGSVKNYFEEESLGAVTVTGQVFGWYTLAKDSAQTCDPFTWSTDARAAAAAAGVNLASYTNVVYAFPEEASCAWAGLGEMPGTESWNDGAFSLRVVAHELGHNFGVHHASSLSCTANGVAVSISTTCTSSEYGDPFTVMGSANTYHDQAFHLAQYGWLPPGDVQSVGPGGPYALGSVLDGPAGSPRLLRIARGNGTWFYLDVRSAHGTSFDRFAAGAPAVTGVTIRISPDAPSPTNGPVQTQLVDANPATSTFNDAPLGVGKTLDDPVSGLRIATVTAAGGAAMVTVTDIAAPGTPTGLTVKATDTSSVELAWTAPSDNIGVTGFQVLRDGDVVGTPGAATFHDGGLAAGRTYGYQVVARDAAGNTSGPASVSATTAAADGASPPPSSDPGPGAGGSPPSGTAPMADATKPIRPASIHRARVGAHRERISWSASTDNVAVAGYRLYRVGQAKPVRTVTGRSVVIARVKGARYYVRAFDAAGNVSPASKRVRAI